MPYYEFYSPDTNTIYTFFARSIAYADRTPRCPDPEHSSARMIKRPSRFALIGRAKEETEAPAETEADRRMEGAMAAMEKEFGGLDEENPDPRQLGRLMRRMCDLTGETMPPEMEEMTRRLEAGEDPEKLEEQFGDVFGDDEAGPGGMGMPGMGDPSGADPGSTSKSKALRSLRLRSRRLRRDATIYEMAEYLDPVAR